MSKAKEVTIQGIVIPARWRRNGMVSAVDIAGYDEQRYRVAEDPVGKKLRLFMQKTVVVDGTVNIANHMKTICVHRFEVVTPDPVHPNKKSG